MRVFTKWNSHVRFLVDKEEGTQYSGTILFSPDGMNYPASLPKSYVEKLYTEITDVAAYAENGMDEVLATRLLAHYGYSTPKGMITAPDDRTRADEGPWEAAAIDYLCIEWDYGFYRKEGVSAS